MSVEAALTSAVGRSRGTAAADRLCEACVDLLSVDAAAISLVFGGANTASLGASSNHARECDELQFMLGEGPCLESVRTQAPVLVYDVAAHIRTGRWPGYGPALLAHGIAAVFAIPILAAGDHVGALDLFRARTEALNADDLAGALVAAELAQLPLLDLLAEDLEATTAGPGGQESTELNKISRAEVSQATGMVIAQLEIEPVAALARIRAHAYATNSSTTDVARDILARRLRLDPH